MQFNLPVGVGHQLVKVRDLERCFAGKLLEIVPPHETVRPQIDSAFYILMVIPRPALERYIRLL
jgi:hypothetical protein